MNSFGSPIRAERFTNPSSIEYRWLIVSKSDGDRPDLVFLELGQWRGLGERGEGLRVVDRLVLRPFQVGEVPECLFPERQRRDLDPCWKRAWRNGEIRPRQMRRRPDGTEQILDQRQVEHLLLRDLEQVRAHDFVSTAWPALRPSSTSRLRRERREGTGR